MKKSFKKAIAVLLAVLMVAFSVPFTALAAAGDYQPNVYLKFGTFHDANNTWQGYDVTAAGADFSMCGLYDVPLDYNNGTIIMSAAKAAKADEVLESGAAPSEDYTYGVGDYFTVTTVLENVDRYWACNAYISYSDNIEPAGYYSYKSGRNTKWAVGTVSEAAAVSGTFTLGGTKAIANMSANEFTDINIMGGEVDDSSFINLDEKRIESSNVNCSGADYASIASIYNEYFADPATGDLSAGYTYTNSVPMETFVFKITGEGPITFDVADPYDTIGAFEGTYFIGQKSDGVMNKDYTTYTPNYDNGTHEGTTENPGSCKMTVFGKNIHVTTECDHATKEVKDAKAATCIAKGYTGDTYCTKCGEKIATGTETAIDPNNHVNTEIINAKEATCAPGYTGDTFCKDCQKTVATGTAIDPVAEHVYTITEETNSDCQTAGKIVRTCSVCGDVQTEYKALGEHSYAEVEGSAVAATCTTPGKTADKVCSVCGDKVAGTETAIDPNNHVGGTVIKNDKAADCGNAGYTGDTYCASCDVKLADGTVIPATGEHNYVDVEGTAVAATCTTAGKEADKECSVCGDKVAGTATAIDPENHVGGTVVKDAKAADCGNAGYTGDTYCASCDVKLADGDVIPATGEHNYVEVPGSAVEPSYEAPGKEADKECSVCGDKITGATIPALKGLEVTVVANDRGAATINGQAVTTEDVTVNVAQNSQVTLTATPNEGVKFVGWSVNGKLVSTEANATITALANMTIEPVYQVVGEEFTVIFMDKFGNVISTQVVKSAAEITVPAVPVIDGYTDAAWSLTADQIAALTESTIIKATYGTAAEKTYTVKAAGATITTPYATAQDVNAGIKYNTLVTVTADGAKAWEMNGKTVAYGDTYSFYVGSDVTLVPVFEDVVNAAPTVAAVSTTKVGSEGAYKASFLATRSMTADCTYVNAGFVYAVNPASNELTLADVNGSTVLAAYCSTDSDQFALTVGRQSQTGVIVARAFIAYVDAAGATQVAYAEPQTFDYSA